jgi:hypothetical protein
MSEYHAPLAEMPAHGAADHVLTRAAGLHDTVVAGAGSVLALAEDQF